MKDYSNPSRKPMMYGGAAKPMKRMSGSPRMGERTVSDKDPVNPKGPTTVGSTQGATPEQEQMQKREMMKRNNSREELKRIATGTSDDALMAASILREMGEKSAMPPGDPEGGSAE